MGFRLHIPVKNITPHQIHTHYIPTHSPLREEVSSGKCQRRLGRPNVYPQGLGGAQVCAERGGLRMKHLR